MDINGKTLSIRAKRVVKYLEASGATMADDLPTMVAANYVGYVTDRIELDYDNAVTELLDAEIVEEFIGDNGYTHVQITK